jgi:pimeloyl-ACP methyl ester carboxylesterase
MGAAVESQSERVAVSDSVSLRVIRREPDRPAPPDVPAYLLVHGMASNARLWDGVADRLASAGRLSVAVDLRGHGLSDKPDSGYDFDTITRDLLALIGTLGPAFENPMVVGQSWGCSVALDLAVKRPDVPLGLVLVDGGLTQISDGFPDWDACWQALEPPHLVGTPVSQIEDYFRSAHADWPGEGIEGSLANFEVREDGTVAPWLARENHKAILHAMWTQPTRTLLAGLRTPTLAVLVDNGQEGWTEAKRQGADWAARVCTASGTPFQTRWFLGDHDLHAQYPDELTAAILEFERADFWAKGEL